MLPITVFPVSRQDPTNFLGMALVRDRFNDFNFQTLYHLFLSTPEFSGRIGEVKILRRGQTAADGLQLLEGPLAPLGPEFVSLGQDLDYYERLAGLSLGLRTQILEALRDALAFPDHAAEFFDEEGWSVSVLRYVEWKTFERDAGGLLSRDYNLVARMGLDLSFQVKGWADPLHLSFAAPGDRLLPERTETLPDRITVLVGRNGAGKSTLMSRLARILHASQKDRSGNTLQALGAITPAGVGFTRVVNLAYSAFDAFQLPGLNHSERRQIVDDMARGTGRYHYCGLRDMGREVRQAEGVGDVDGNPIPSAGLDRQQRIILKTSEAMAEEFANTVRRIRDMDRMALFAEVCRILSAEASFDGLEEDLVAAVTAEPAERFDRWSTGHKIVMHALVSLVAFTEPKSIVLFDEPETHLHPPLLAALMHAMRLVLRRNDAFAVVATHSPVVVQETLARHVAVVRRAGETVIRRPVIETYGESIGEITNELFGLAAEVTDFHQTLADLVARNLSLEQIEALFDGRMSLQARAFVMTLLATR